MKHKLVQYGIPYLIAILLGLVLVVTHAPVWVAFVSIFPLVFFGCWWAFIYKDGK